VLLVGFLVYAVVYIMTKIFQWENARAVEQAKQIEELNKAQSRFFSSMSHEIRTPINTIIGLNEMILREDISDEVADDARNVRSASKILLSLINDILDMSKIESGKMDIVIQPYDVGAMFSDIVNMIWIRASEKGLKFSIDVDPSLPSSLVSDEVRIKQILINLLNNAVKYTEEGSVTLSIHCNKTGPNKVLVTYSVEDTGIGIRKESIPMLFDAFRREDQKHTRYIEGTGLGLSIVKQLADLLGGDVSVNSIYTKGSTFVFTLEQEIADERALGKYEPARFKGAKKHEYHQTFEAPSAKVLLVDDNTANLMVATKLLRDTKVQVSAAESGTEALRLTAEEHFNVILMDHMMPDMDGVETLHKMKADRLGLNYETPVIMLTANAIYGVKEEYIKEGFTDYISKPLRGDILEEMIRKYLEKDAAGNLLVEYTQKGGQDKSSWKVYSSTDSYGGTDIIARKGAAKSAGIEFEETSKQEPDNTKKESEEIAALRKSYGDFLDIDTALMYSGNDAELFIEIAQSYLKNDLTERLENLYSIGDYDNYRIKVHSLKSSSLNIGAINMSKLATEMDAAIKNSDTHYVILNHEALMDEYKKIIEGLRENLG
jgi:CheY-like chemotaxis protein/nitrogen-specific signal transduction histidine kinase/HPt (histidine-containing phosphotransfer) domain-containing protein